MDRFHDLEDLMMKADLAFGAGGTPTLEGMALGLSSLVITIAATKFQQLAYSIKITSFGLSAIRMELLLIASGKPYATKLRCADINIVLD